MVSVTKRFRLQAAGKVIACMPYPANLSEDAADLGSYASGVRAEPLRSGLVGVGDGCQSGTDRFCQLTRPSKRLSRRAVGSP